MSKTFRRDSYSTYKVYRQFNKRDKHEEDGKVFTSRDKKLLKKQLKQQNQNKFSLGENDGN